MSDPNAEQDPFAAGRAPEQPNSPADPPPPPYGAQPPAYGAQPPAYGAQPPAYGAQPPAYGAQPPAYGAQPPAYGAPQPPAYGGQTPYGAQPGGYGQAPQAPGGYYGQQPYGYPKNSLAVWSLVLAIVGFFVCGFFTAIPAIIVGNKANQAVAEGQANNGGMAKAGIIIGWIVTGLSILGILVVILIVATGNWASFTSSSY